jgi:uncharacterized protein (DUF2141 family)
MRSLLLVSLLILNTTVLFSQNKGKIRVMIQGLKNNMGLIGVRIYNQPEGFPSEKMKALQELYVKPVNGEAVLEFSDLNFGTYAIGCIHDENDSKDMDRNFIGIPKEGFGTSNNPKVLFGPPSFKEAKFELREEIHIVIIKMVYF